MKNQIVIYDENIQSAYTQLLEQCHSIEKHSSSVSLGKWSNSIDFCYWDFDIIELQNKTITIFALDDDYEKSSAIAKSFGLILQPANAHIVINHNKIDKRGL